MVPSRELRAGCGRWFALFPLLLWCGEALASGGGHDSGFSLKEHGFYVFNFVVFVGLIIYFARKPVGALLAGRAESFRSRLEAARVHAEKAERELGEAREKTRNAAAEKAALTQRLEAEGQALKESIVGRARDEEARIRSGAEANLASEKARLERGLQVELALSALDLAETRLRQQWRTLPHGRYAREFVAEVNRPEGEAR
ncbi:MAG: ATP synthase F0 subunit B [Deltaproteobacteria bacterium]|nr:ATP synthase F0 subunit B [Deltaproteobacteria bacterium]